MDNRIFVSGDVAVIEIYHRATERYFYVLVDEEDVEKIRSNAKSLSISITQTNNYCQYRSFDKRSIPLHRLIMDTPSHLVVDHIFYNGLDNRKSRLRNTTHKVNSNNKNNGFKNPLHQIMCRGYQIL